MPRPKTLLILLCAVLLFSCGSIWEQKPTEKGTIGYIDIPSPGFFWLVYPWKEGKLATIDGKGRFAEISFVGKWHMRIKPLVNFPGERIDRLLRVATESNIFVTKSGEEFFVADVAAKKTKSLVPWWGWRFKVGVPVFLDSENGIINFNYYASDDYKSEPGSQPYYNVIYDAKNDQVLYESPKEVGENFGLDAPITPEWAMAEIPNDDGIPGTKTILYNWKTHETAENELTKKLIIPGLSSIWDPGQNHNLEGRYLFADIPPIPGEMFDKKVKVTWDENYENVTVIPLDYMMPPEAKWWYDFYLSADGKWATNLFGGYRGLYGESLARRVFFHLDARYPNGMSMPIFVDGYHNDPLNYGSFVEHPAHGLCYAEEVYNQYLRLYKMDEVLAEINRQAADMAAQ
ncbi:MAG: hypothetical protein LBI14_10875 [Treponema sp.]|jgi:hypothetical protein|nr:hypothetical protein [Treponema sp.]